MQGGKYLVERGIKEIENPDELLEMGLISGIQSGLFDNAIEFFGKAIELEPNNYRAWFLLGVAYDYQGKNQKGNECYRKALEINPDCIEALVNLGTNYSKEGNLNMAIECFLEALDIKPDYHEAMVNLAICYLERGDIEEAIDACQRALLFESNSAVAYNTLGRAYMQLNEIDKNACETLQKNRPNWNVKQGDISKIDFTPLKGIRTIKVVPFWGLLSTKILPR